MEFIFRKDDNMSITEVKFQTSDILNATNEKIIKDSLGITDAQLQDAFNKIAKSAFTEYLKMFTESGVPLERLK